MRAIMNTYAKNKYSHYNGWTFDIIGHQNGCIMLSVDSEQILMPLTEVLIIDIQLMVYHAEIRAKFLGFDYWRDLLIKYCKMNKICIKPISEIAIKEIALPLENSDIEQEIEEEEINFITVNDEDIL